jgi:hypothetical protein
VLVAIEVIGEDIVRLALRLTSSVSAFNYNATSNYEPESLRV